MLCLQRKQEVEHLQHTGNIFTPTEWKLMECLWQTELCTGREAVSFMKRAAGWSRSTTLTMLRRMTEKGAIDCRTQDGVNVYRALVPRESAVQRETEEFLDRVYHGSVGLLLSAMTERQHLSQAEIDELYDILRKAEEVKK